MAKFLLLTLAPAASATNFLIAVDPDTGGSRFVIGEISQQTRPATPEMEGAAYALGALRLVEQAGPGTKQSVVEHISRLLAPQPMTDPASLAQVIQNKGAVEEENQRYLSQPLAAAAPSRPVPGDQVKRDIDPLVVQALQQAATGAGVDPQVADKIAAKAEASKNRDLTSAPSLLDQNKAAQLAMEKQKQLELQRQKKARQQQQEKQLAAQNDQLLKKIQQQQEKQKQQQIAEQKLREQQAKEKVLTQIGSRKDAMRTAEKNRQQQNTPKQARPTTASPDATVAATLQALSDTRHFNPDDINTVESFADHMAASYGLAASTTIATGPGHETDTDRTVAALTRLSLIDVNTDFANEIARQEAIAEQANEVRDQLSGQAGGYSWADFTFYHDRHYYGEELAVTRALDNSETATYTGLVSGSFGSGESANGTITMDITFTDGSVVGRVDFNHGMGQLLLNDTINAGEFSVEAVGEAYGGFAAGYLGGNLFGPRAEEVGGSWEMDIQGGAMNGESATGDFAAKQQH